MKHTHKLFGHESKETSAYESKEHKLGNQKKQPFTVSGLKNVQFYKGGKK